MPDIKSLIGALGEGRRRGSAGRAVAVASNRRRRPGLNVRVAAQDASDAGLVGVAWALTYSAELAREARRLQAGHRRDERHERVPLREQDLSMTGLRHSDSVVVARSPEDIYDRPRLRRHADR